MWLSGSGSVFESRKQRVRRAAPARGPRNAQQRVVPLQLLQRGGAQLGAAIHRQVPDAGGAAQGQQAAVADLWA